MKLPLNRTERAVLRELHRLAAKYGQDRIFPARHHLSGQLGLGKRTVTRAMGMLIAAGHVEQIERGATSCQYLLKTSFGQAFGHPSEFGHACEVVETVSLPRKSGHACGHAAPLISPSLTLPTCEFACVGCQDSGILGGLVGGPDAEWCGCVSGSALKGRDPEGLVVVNAAKWKLEAMEKPKLVLVVVNRPAIKRALPREDKAMKVPAFYTTAEEIRLFHLAEVWLAQHPEVTPESTGIGSLSGLVGTVMHRLEDAGALLLPEAPQVLWVPVAGKKPVASEVGLELLRRAIR